MVEGVPKMRNMLKFGALALATQLVATPTAAQERAAAPILPTAAAPIPNGHATFEVEIAAGMNPILFEGCVYAAQIGLTHEDLILTPGNLGFKSHISLTQTQRDRLLTVMRHCNKVEAENRRRNNKQ